MNLKRLLTALQNVHSDKMCPNAEFMGCMTKQRTKLLSWSWAGSVMNRSASIRRYCGTFIWRMISEYFSTWIYCNCFLLTCHTGSEWTAGAGQSCCSGSSWGDGCRLRNTMVCPVFSVFGAVEISDRFWGDPLDMANLSEFIFWSMSCKTPIMEVWNLDWLISELWCLHSGEVLASSGT